MELINKNFQNDINRYIEFILPKYDNKELIEYLNIDKIFDYEHIFNNIIENVHTPSAKYDNTSFKNKLITYLKLNNCEALQILEKYLLALDTKLYYGSFNTILYNKHMKVGPAHYFPSIILYTDRNLIIECTINTYTYGKEACFTFKSFIKTIDPIEFSLRVERHELVFGDRVNGQDSFCLKHYPKKQEEYKNLINQSIKYINPQIYADYLTTCENDSIYGLINRTDTKQIIDKNKKIDNILNDLENKCEQIKLLQNELTKNKSNYAKLEETKKTMILYYEQKITSQLEHNNKLRETISNFEQIITNSQLKHNNDALLQNIILNNKKIFIIILIFIIIFYCIYFIIN